MQKNGTIVRVTADELKAMREQGATGSDWPLAAAAPIPDGSDPDDAMEAVDPSLVSIGIPAFSELETQTTLRIDSDVLRWFKSQGEDYRLRINAVLRSFYEDHRQ